MSIANLSPDARGFLYNLFHKAAHIYEGCAVTGPQQAVKASELAGQFRSAAFTARRGTESEINSLIPALVAGVSDPDLQDAVRDIELVQEQFYRGWVRNSAALQADLGSYSHNIF